jgi:hypothetical protein
MGSASGIYVTGAPIGVLRASPASSFVASSKQPGITVLSMLAAWIAALLAAGTTRTRIEASDGPSRPPA